MGDASSSSPSAPKSIAVITCSTRPGRVGSYIATHVFSVLEAHLATTPSKSAITLHRIDLSQPPGLLPVSVEPDIPAGFPKDDPTPHYKSEVVRAWSAEISRHDGFIFVTPQYNWGYPATVKNAIDYLYWEWVGKVGAVVSYGNRGGNLSNAQLRQVLGGVRMRVIAGIPGRSDPNEEKQPVEIKIHPEEGAAVVQRAALGDELVNRWREQGVEEGLREYMNEMARLVDDSVSPPH